VRDNDASAVAAFAKGDRLLQNRMTGPGPDFDLEADAVRLGAFRLLEIELGHVQERLQLASLEAATEDDLVCRLTSGLWPALTERHRLFRLQRSALSEGSGNDPFFVFGDRAVFPHPFIRGCRELLGDLMGLGWQGADVHVALDPVRALPLADAGGHMLFDYWFGCRLTRADLDDLSHVGETWHVRPLDQKLELGTKPLAATVFRWKADGAIKTLEVDEIVPAGETEPSGPYYVNRYLHALRDTEAHRFVHVDGAVRAYTAASYTATRANPKGTRGNAVRYRKLFRVDGPLDDNVWGRIVAHFFRGNELVIEYFGELLDERRGAELPAATSAG
jgi:hypothetical protein